MNYNKLFLKLLDRGTLAYIVRLLLLWYQSQKIMVQCGLFRSTAIGITNCVEQESSISPLLFNVYIYEMSHLLSSSGAVCHIDVVPVNVFTHADEHMLLAPTTRVLKSLLEFFFRNCIS